MTIILVILKDKYPARTIQQSLEKAIYVNDLEMVENIIHRYTSYLPVNWNYLYEIAKSTRMRSLLKNSLLEGFDDIDRNGDFLLSIMLDKHPKIILRYIMFNGSPYNIYPVLKRYKPSSENMDTYLQALAKMGYVDLLDLHRDYLRKYRALLIYNNNPYTQQYLAYLIE